MAGVRRQIADRDDLAILIDRPFSFVFFFVFKKYSVRGENGGEQEASRGDNFNEKQRGRRVGIAQNRYRCFLAACCVDIMF